MRSGYMYVPPIDSGWYALIPTRRWYAPWLWDVRGCRSDGCLYPYPLLMSKVRYAEAYGLMKLLGATNLEN